jgi:hypothetical protein
VLFVIRVSLLWNKLIEVAVYSTAWLHGAHVGCRGGANGHSAGAHRGRSRCQPAE